MSKEICSFIASFVLAGFRDKYPRTPLEHDNWLHYALSFLGAKPCRAGGRVGPTVGVRLAPGTLNPCVCSHTRAACSTHVLSVDPRGSTHPCESVRMHVCAHMPCVRSWIPQDLNTSVRVGVGVCAGMLPVHSSAPAQPAVIAARLFSLLLFLDFFFLLKTQHLIISHPRNITAFSQQLN